MLRRPRFNQSAPIGCSWRGGQIRLAQIVGNDPDAASVRVATAVVTEGGAASGSSPGSPVSSAIRSALAQAPFVGTGIAMCVDRSRTPCRCLRLAPMPAAELPAAVHWQTAKQLGLKVEEFSSGFYDVGDVLELGRTRREVISLAAINSETAAITSAVGLAGCRLVAIDGEVGALARCFDDNHRSDAHSAVLVLDVGPENTMFMVARHGLPCFVRTVAVGIRGMIERAIERHAAHVHEVEAMWYADHNSAEAMPAADQESVGSPASQALHEAIAMLARELAREAKVCMHYLADGLPTDVQPSVGCILGAGAAEDAIRSAMSEATDVEFIPLLDALSPSLRACTSQAPIHGTLHDWLVPLGMALYGEQSRLGLPTTAGLNLMPSAVVAARTNRRPRTRVHTAVAAGIVAIAAGGAGLHILSLDRRVEARERQVQSLRQAATEQSGMSVQRLERVAGTESLPVAAILALLSQVTPPEMVFRSFAVRDPIVSNTKVGPSRSATVPRRANPRVELEGWALTDAAIATMTSRLAACGFEQVQIDESKEVMLMERPCFQFRVSMTVPGMVASAAIAAEGDLRP